MQDRITQPSDIKINGQLGISFNWAPDFASRMNNRIDTVQKTIDNEVIKQMAPYTPFRTGVLEHSATQGTVIGSGLIVQSTPYARYLYYGEVYGPNFPIFEGGQLVGFYSPPSKNPTGRALQYDKNAHPLAGKMWFERMKADKLEVILEAAKRVMGGF